MSSVGGNPFILPVEVFVVEIEERVGVGTSSVLVRGGKKSFLNSWVVLV